jgi:hypothetical protein
MIGFNIGDAMDCGSLGKETNSNFSQGGNLDRVELLLDKRVGVNSVHEAGKTALMSAAATD